jgi:hypothetical protein
VAPDEEEEIIGHLLLRMNKKRDDSNQLIGWKGFLSILRVDLFLSIDDELAVSNGNKIVLPSIPKY